MLRRLVLVATLGLLGCGDTAVSATPDGGHVAHSCNNAADCPPNPGASCAQVCADGSNPCSNACVANACVERGCPVVAQDAGAHDTLVGSQDLAHDAGGHDLVENDVQPLACNVMNDVLVGQDTGATDAGNQDAGTMCHTSADCPVNTGASCATVCADGSNPCVNACLNNVCAPRGCPSTDGGSCQPIGGACTANSDCCDNNCITRVSPGFCCQPGGCP